VVQLAAHNAFQYIGVAYYAEATAGGVIVLVAVTIYVAAVGLGKLQHRVGATAVPVAGPATADETDGD